MNNKEYKQLIKQGDVLSKDVLKVTKEELEKIGLIEISKEIDRVLNDNEIEQPVNDNSKTTEDIIYYRIDLSTEHISQIVEMFGDLEVSSLGFNYESTSEASYYASLLDKWNDLPMYR